MSRFDYVAYDSGASADQNEAKFLVTKLETMINGIGYAQGKLSPECSRSIQIALAHLEETYMWIGKAIRDDQVARNQNLGVK